MIGTVPEAKYAFLIISRSFILRTRNISDKSCEENQNIHFMFSNFFFFSKIVPFMRYVERYRRTIQAADDNLAHEHYMLDN